MTNQQVPTPGRDATGTFSREQGAERYVIGIGFGTLGRSSTIRNGCAVAEAAGY
ncbi:MAG: hypothetical protein ABWY57_12900 [Mycetocola sp.]